MLHQVLKKLRKEKKFTQEDVAKGLGIARTTYSGYERGTSEPDIEGLRRIADFFGVSVEFLLNTNKVHSQLNNKESDFSLPESEYDRVIKEVEEKYHVNLRDDPTANKMIREIILGLAKMKSENE